MFKWLPLLFVTLINASTLAVPGQGRDLQHLGATKIAKETLAAK